MTQTRCQHVQDSGTHHSIQNAGKHKEEDCVVDLNVDCEAWTAHRRLYNLLQESRNAAHRHGRGKKQAQASIPEACTNIRHSVSDAHRYSKMHMQNPGLAECSHQCCYTSLQSIAGRLDTATCMVRFHEAAFCQPNIASLSFKASDCPGQHLREQGKRRLASI